MATPTDKLDDLHGKVDAILNILRGSHDASGKWTPGMAPRLDDHERRIGELEEAQDQATARQMNWRHALGLTLAGGFVSQALTWMKEHIR